MDFHGWQQDVEFMATLYNCFLRHDQINAVEASAKFMTFTKEEASEIQQLRADGLLAFALGSGDVNSSRDLLKKS